MTPTREIIGEAVCMDSSGAPHLTFGKAYRVVDEFAIDGTMFFNVLCDKGTLFTYSAQRFQWKEKQ